MKKIKILAMVCSLSLLLCAFSSTAYASGGDNWVEAVPEKPVTEKVTPVEPTPLTPNGNLSLVDDIQGEQANGKQFVTVQSKAGNYFYLIIDRDGDKENVYFLNLVDEADLLALIEEPPVKPTPEPTPPPVEEEKPPVVEEKPKEKSNAMGILALFLILGLAGGGTIYYLKVLKPKQNNKGNTNLDEYDFEDEDDEELILDELSEDEFDNEDSKDH